MARRAASRSSANRQLSAAERRLEQERDRLSRRVERLERKNKQLTLDVQQARRAAKRQAAPFRRRERVKEPKRPGRKAGHPAANRAVPAHVDRVIKVPLCACPECRGSVENVEDLASQYVIDLPCDIAPEVTRFDGQSGYCPRCERRVRSRHPEQISNAIGAAGVQIGARALSLATDLKHRVGVPYRKIVDIFALAFGLVLTAGALCRAEKRIAERCVPTYNALAKVMRRAAVVHADETGWHVVEATKKAWLWVFASTTPRITIYAIRLSRGSDVVVDILGKAFDGVLAVDGWAAYTSVACLKGQCSAHLLRRCSELLEVQKRGAARFAHTIRSLLRLGMLLKDHVNVIPPKRYVHFRDKLRALMAKALRGRVRDSANRKFLKHLLNHEDEIFRYLDVHQLPPTNNFGEQEVRPAVVIRKISAGNRTMGGARTHEVLATVSRTAGRNGLSMPRLLPALLRSTDPAAVLPLIPELGLPDG